MLISDDFCRKVLSVRKKEGLTIAEVASRFCVGVASVTRWLKNPESQKTRNKPASKIDMAALARDVLAFPDAYQYERARRLGVSETLESHVECIDMQSQLSAFLDLLLEHILNPSAPTIDNLVAERFFSAIITRRDFWSDPPTFQRHAQLVVLVVPDNDAILIQQWTKPFFQPVIKNSSNAQNLSHRRFLYVFRYHIQSVRAHIT